MDYSNILFKNNNNIKVNKASYCKIPRNLWETQDLCWNNYKIWFLFPYHGFFITLYLSIWYLISYVYYIKPAMLYHNIIILCE